MNGGGMFQDLGLLTVAFGNLARVSARVQFSAAADRSAPEARHA
jgi:hypothetical protein